MVAVAWTALPARAAGPRFERLDAGLPTTGQWRNGFDLADVDGDGHVDLIHGPPRRGERVPTLFRGSGDGRFVPSLPGLFAEAPFDYGDAAAADLDGDGRVDLAFAVHLGGVTAFLAGPDGDFLRSVEGLELRSPGAVDFSSRAFEAADWNGDGRIDLVALGEGPARGSPHPRRGLAVFLNLESGWRRAPGPDDRAFGDSLALGDLDGDGRTDAVVASRRLDDRAPFRIQRPEGGWEIVVLETIRPRSYFPSVAATRLEESRLVEFALSWVELSGHEWRSGVDLFTQQLDGWRRTELVARPGARETRALAAGDLDGDGYRDLVAIDDRGEVTLFLGRADGTLTERRNRALARAGSGCSGRHARLHDIDEDGRPELLMAFASEPDGSRCEAGGSLQAWKIRIR